MKEHNLLLHSQFMKPRRIISLLLFAVALITASASPVSKDMARDVASKYFISKKKVVNLAYAMPNAGSRKMLGCADKTEPFYIFNAEGNNGFVIVSGDDNAPAILGYADSGVFSWDDLPGSMTAWLKMNADYMSRCSDNSAKSIQKAPGKPVVEPLLGNILWGQDEPFNNMCPTYTSGGETKHYYVGCVATAATQIMYYHKYPAQGNGSKSYNMHGNVLTADFGATNYQWDLMLPSYREIESTQAQKDAVATLASHFGISVEMQYEINGSGASSIYVPVALRDYFRYDKNVVMVKRDFYTSSEWMDIIKTELNSGRPVYYGATSMDGLSGHAFVCDGYDDAGYVHINWGWYGKSNGYFLVNHLDPDDLGEGGGTGGYNLSQEVVIGIQPEGSTVPTQHFGNVYGASRLSCTSFGTDFMLMSFIENYDKQAFNGKIAAVVCRDGNIIKVLKEEDLNINGFANSKTGYVSMTMKNIPVTVSGVENGKCEIRFAIKNNDAEEWTLLRHGKGYADHADAEVSNGKLKNIEQYNAHPNVKLLKQLNAEDEVYARGCALFKVKLQNMSDDIMLSNVVLRWTSAADETKTYESSHSVNVYDNSTESFDIVANLDEEMEEGIYYITMYEKGHEDYPFDDSEVGSGVVEVLPAKQIPYMRMNYKPMWSSGDGSTESIRQGDMMHIIANACNYGAAGEATAIAKLTDIDNPEKTYIFRQTSILTDRGNSSNFTFSRRIPVDPGTYCIDICFIDEDGVERKDTKFEDNKTIVSVVKNTENELLRIVEFSLPETMYIGEEHEGKLVVASDTGFDGKLYVRIRPYTLMQGELAWMGSAKISEGNDGSVVFKYKPSVEPGKYLALIEGKVGNEECTVGGYANGYRLFDIINRTTEIRDVKAIANVYAQSGTVIVEAEKPVTVSIYNTGGSCVKKQKCQQGTNRIELQKGIYLIRTDDGKTSKIAIR